MPYQTQAVTTVNRGALSPIELATRWGKSRQHIYDLIARGQIRSFKSGRSRLISMAEVERAESGSA